MVWRGIYRSSFPTKRNFGFLRQLGLKSVIYLCPEEYPESHHAFLAECGSQLLHHGVEGNKEPFDEIPEDAMRGALRAVLDERNRPLLIHCNQGKHRTGCLVGCFRKAQRWSLVAIFEEYRRYADRKARIVDQQFIERIDLSAEEELYERGGGAADDDGQHSDVAVAPEAPEAAAAAAAAAKAAKKAAKAAAREAAAAAGAAVTVT